MKPNSKFGTNMKIISILVCTMFLLLTGIVLADGATPQLNQPDMAIFDSIAHIRKFIASKAKQNYSNMKLTRISLESCDGVPRRGAAYVYFFNSMTVGRMPALCIYHFIDGEIIETSTGM